MGAIVVPRHTSPTAKRPFEQPARGWFASTLKRVAPPPVAALMPWEETGDCWCASKTGKMGRLQLAVLTEHKIMPKELIIEHIPQNSELDRDCAPKSWQLWAEIFDKEEAEDLKDKIGRYHSTSFECSPSASPPSESSICFAQGTSNRRLENWVQSSRMLFYTHHPEARVETGKFYFRVLSNYGSSQTCIYRVRLTAHDINLGNDLTEKLSKNRPETGFVLGSGS